MSDKRANEDVVGVGESKAVAESGYCPNCGGQLSIGGTCHRCKERSQRSQVNMIRGACPQCGHNSIVIDLRPIENPKPSRWYEIDDWLIDLTRVKSVWVQEGPESGPGYMLVLYGSALADQYDCLSIQRTKEECFAEFADIKEKLRALP